MVLEIRVNPNLQAVSNQDVLELADTVATRPEQDISWESTVQVLYAVMNENCQS